MKKSKNKLFWKAINIHWKYRNTHKQDIFTVFKVAKTFFQNQVKISLKILGFFMQEISIHVLKWLCLPARLAEKNGLF